MTFRIRTETDTNATALNCTVRIRCKVDGKGLPTVFVRGNRLARSTTLPFYVNRVAFGVNELEYRNARGNLEDDFNRISNYF